MNIKTKLNMNDFIEMEQLEKKYYAEEYITSAKESYEWYTNRPCSIIALEHNQQLIGFINLFPISEKIFQGISAGTFNDKYLTWHDIIQIEEDNVTEVNLFLSCVVIEEKYRHLGALAFLLSSYAAYYHTYEERGISIKNVIGDAVTEAGQRFFIKIGLEKHRLSAHQSTIYIGSYYQFVLAVEKIWGQKQ